MSDDPCSLSIEPDYQQGLHVGTLFLIMGCSLFGTLTPVIAKKYTFLSSKQLPFNCAKMFGCGVILATSLVHMLVPSTQSLSNPCLPPTFSSDYTAFSAVFCLFAILSLHFVQFMLGKEIRRLHLHKFPETREAEITESHDGHDHTHGHELILTQERHLATYILEIGIASHSVIIGVALGVARGSDFHSLIIAISFHQFFEGMALSTVVLDSNFAKSWASIFAVVFYTLTTPTGIAIGIGINQSFNANSNSSLLAQGILDGISAGILLYDGLVNIVNEHFKTASFQKSSNASQFLQFGCLWVGTGIMALIGRWA